jgi:hypothetical protein
LKSSISFAVYVSALEMTGTTAVSLLMADIMIQSEGGGDGGARGGGEGRRVSTGLRCSWKAWQQAAIDIVLHSDIKGTCIY